MKSFNFYRRKEFPLAFRHSATPSQCNSFDNINENLLVFDTFLCKLQGRK